MFYFIMIFSSLVHLCYTFVSHYSHQTYDHCKVSIQNRWHRHILASLLLEQLRYLNGKIMSESEPCSAANSLICMRTHKAHATRWPPYRHLPSEHLPSAFKRAHPKHAPQHCDHQLPVHLYISPRIASIKTHHTSVKHLCLSVVLSHYNK